MSTSASDRFCKLRCQKSAREAHLVLKSVKLTVSDHFLRSGCGFGWQALWIVHLVKSEPSVWVLQRPKKNGGRRTFEEGLQRCISRWRRMSQTWSEVREHIS